MSMPHKCTKCGREYKDGSTEILKGCASCGGKKFLYVKDTEINKDVLEEKSIEDIARETHEEILQVVEPRTNRKWRCLTGSRRSVLFLLAHMSSISKRWHRAMNGL